MQTEIKRIIFAGTIFNITRNVWWDTTPNYVA
jgi:hypothetical protein